MLIYCLVIASILIQLTTAFLALRLITITGKQLSWIFILTSGKIRLESVKGQGSSFYITFPLEGESGLKSIPSDKIKAEDEVNIKVSDLPVILIAEDEETSSSFLQMILEKKSFNCLLAYNGREAVDICLNHPEISVVLMDLRMPVMDGLEATCKIKEFRQNLPIIAVTAYAMTGDKEKALEAGCDDYISKPVNTNLLLSVIRKHLHL
jgi:CheY-like chemotaxis protein